MRLESTHMCGGFSSVDACTHSLNELSHSDDGAEELVRGKAFCVSHTQSGHQLTIEIFEIDMRAFADDGAMN